MHSAQRPARRYSHSRVESDSRPRKRANPATPPHQTGRADFPHPAFLQAFLIGAEVQVLVGIDSGSFLSGGGISFGFGG